MDPASLEGAWPAPLCLDGEVQGPCSETLGSPPAWRAPNLGQAHIVKHRRPPASHVSPLPWGLRRQVQGQARGCASTTAEEVSGQPPRLCCVIGGCVDRLTSTRCPFCLQGDGRRPHPRGEVDRDPLSVLSLLFCGT